MAAYWKSIDKFQEGTKTVQLKAVRADKNSRDEEFTNDVIVFVGLNDQESVSNMSDSELETFVENNCDLTLVDKGLTTEDPPPDHNFLIQPEPEE